MLFGWIRRFPSACVRLPIGFHACASARGRDSHLPVLRVLLMAEPPARRARASISTEALWSASSSCRQWAQTNSRPHPLRDAGSTLPQAAQVWEVWNAGTAINSEPYKRHLYSS